MANIINRAEYGNLGCLWGVFKSRFTSSGDEIKPMDLKCSPEYGINPIDVCPGRQELPEHIAKHLGRTHYCPFLKTRTDERICQWVHAIGDNDSQKSKPVGQTCIAMNIFGLCDLITQSNGILKKIKWTAEAEDILNLSWGSSELNEYLTKKILSYGPVVNLIHNLHKSTSMLIRNTDLYQVLSILPTNEPVETICQNGTITRVQTWDGNTSNDAVTRSTTALLMLCASANLVKPVGYPTDYDLTPFRYSNWLTERALDNKKHFPRKWSINKSQIEQIVSNGLDLSNGITYEHFIPKATDRNLGNRCRCCKENVINNARIQFGNKSKNRKLLLIEALRKANETNTMISLSKLAEVSLQDEQFYISKDSQYETILNIERFNVALYGYINTLENDYLTPTINVLSNNAICAPSFVKLRIEELLNNDEIFVERLY
ncbi:hypothetical protein [Methanolobus halotolerans]|uniref:Uncharacterized protein n=1 Tax=Methanolobus halotolerans TaxID=2052935 RepID=A0A4E0Q7J3_9EURY|nr:hypothetical protein [Methanolobus halotolerans]TGC07012.1 hypothetical protein CUN85_12010 [Methanolobus halotolerans]